MPGGYYFATYALLAEFATTYLIHCPTHYVVGTAVGLRFRSIRAGRSTLVRVLPRSVKSIGRFLPILTLTLDRSSLSGVGVNRVRAMYASGTLASSGSTVLIAAWASLSGQLAAEVICWALAGAYVLFDVVFSPRSGDLMRARNYRIS